MHATFKVFNAASTGTGFLLRDTAPDAARTQVVLVTAKHAFERAKGDHVLLVCRVKDATNRWQRLDHKVMIREGSRDLWTGHPTQDIAVLCCTLPTNAVFEALPVEALASEARARASGLSSRQTTTPSFFSPERPLRATAARRWRWRRPTPSCRWRSSV